MGRETFRLPDLGEGLEEGEIVSWLVDEGDEVTLNQPLVEVETAKAAVEIPSPFAGRIVELHADAGDAIPVGSPLVTFDVAGAGAPDGGRTAAARAPAEATVVVAPERPSSGRRSVAATPAVRKLAKDLGISLDDVRGTGPDGRVTADDVRAAAGERPDAAEPPDTAERPAAAPTADADRIELTPTRRTIARRLEAAAAVPQVTTFRTVDCTHLEELRRELDASPLPILVAVLCRTIAGHRLLNASWADDAILVHRGVHVGVAVDTERGLLVPVVRDAQDRSIGELAAEIARLAEAARGGSLSPDDLAGSTISVSNTGSYGSEAGTPLLNPPNAVTIAIGAIRPRPLVDDGAVQARPACTLSLTFDHRVLDGATAGRALTDLVELLQDAAALRDLPR